jgi:hypothetical protein
MEGGGRGVPHPHRPCATTTRISGRGHLIVNALGLLAVELFSFLIPLEPIAPRGPALTLANYLAQFAPVWGTPWWLTLWLPLHLLPLGVGVVGLATLVRGVEVYPEGVRVMRGLYSECIPWGRIWPASVQTSPFSFAFQYFVPSSLWSFREARVTWRQARAILLSPYAPRWQLSPRTHRRLAVAPVRNP